MTLIRVVPYAAKLQPKFIQELYRTPSSFSPGTGSCPGCAGMLAVRQASRVINYTAQKLNAQAVHTQQTGCIQVVVSSGDLSAGWESFLHSSFSDGPSVLTGMVAAYTARRAGGEDVKPTLFWNFSGDGGTYNIGLRSFSAFLQSGRGLLLIYDNRGFMNTGAQWSSSTLPGEKRMTAQTGPAQVGAEEQPKDMLRIAAAHGVPYAASAALGTPALIKDFMRKIMIGILTGRAGPAVVVVDAPCPREQKFKENKMMEVGNLAVATGAFRVLEYINGKWLINAEREKEGSNYLPVDGFLASQGNLRHLLQPKNRPLVEKLQAYIDDRWRWTQNAVATTDYLLIDELTVPLSKVLAPEK